MSEITLKRVYNKLKREFAINILHKRNDPSLMIIGAQKAATSSLAFYLDQHPDFEISINKEVHFFDRDDNYNKGLDWYRKQFITRQNSKSSSIFFEATPDYMYSKQAIKRIATNYPEMKLVMILRNPVNRAYSAWNMYKDFATWKKLPSILYTGYIDGKENNIYKEFYAAKKFPAFEECIEQELLNKNEEPSLIRRGLYLQQLNYIYDYFPKENILILGFKDIVENLQTSLNKILSFLSIPNSDWDFLVKEVINSRPYPSKINADTQSQLNLFYEKHNNELFKTLGYKPNW